MRAGDWPLTVGEGDLTEMCVMLLCFFFVFFSSALLGNVTRWITKCNHVVKMYECTFDMCVRLCNSMYRARMCVFGLWDEPVTPIHQSGISGHADFKLICLTPQNAFHTCDMIHRIPYNLKCTVAVTCRTLCVLSNSAVLHLGYLKLGTNTRLAGPLFML